MLKNFDRLENVFFPITDAVFGLTETLNLISIVLLPRRIRRLAVARFCKRDIKFMVIEQPLLTDRTQ